MSIGALALGATTFVAGSGWSAFAAALPGNAARSAAVVTFIGTDVVIALGKLPGFRVDRAAQRAWLVIAMASTVAGNLTLVGSIANLIVA
jgi:Na+/H+ antiporter NhaD/arsenite permease-like protein